MIWELKWSDLNWVEIGTIFSSLKIQPQKWMTSGGRSWLASSRLRREVTKQKTKRMLTIETQIFWFGLNTPHRCVSVRWWTGRQSRVGRMPVTRSPRGSWWGRGWAAGSRWWAAASGSPRSCVGCCHWWNLSCCWGSRCFPPSAALRGQWDRTRERRVRASRQSG